MTRTKSNRQRAIDSKEGKTTTVWSSRRELVSQWQKRWKLNRHKILIYKEVIEKLTRDKRAVGKGQLTSKEDENHYRLVIP